MDITAHTADIMRQHGDSGQPTWANERICLCGVTYRTMMPGPDFADHLADVLTSEFDIRQRLEQLAHSRHDVITFAIRDYANDLPGEEPGNTFIEGLWRAADDIASLIEQRLDADSLS